MLSFFNKNYILFLFLIVPVGYLVSYFLIKLGASNINSYFSLITILLLSYLVSKKGKILLSFVLLLYFFFNIFFFEGNLNSNAREACQFILYLITMFSVEVIIKMIQKLKPKIVLIFFDYFSIFFTLLFVITAAYEGKAVFSNIDDVERSYYNGFVISHMFSYYAILLGFVLAKFRKWYKAIALIVLALIVGNRISILTLLGAFVLFIEGEKNFKTGTFLKKASYLFLIFSLFYLFYLYFLTDSFNWRNLSDFLLNNDYQKFTSGRSLFWYNGLNELRKTSLFSFNFFFGKGPDSVEKLAINLYGQYYWMHNDFMQIVYCYGFIGILMYVYAIYKFTKKVNSSVAFWLILITAMFNGFYTYGAFQLIVMIILIGQPVFAFESKFHKIQYVNYE